MCSMRNEHCPYPQPDKSNPWPPSWWTMDWEEPSLARKQWCTAECWHALGATQDLLSHHLQCVSAVIPRARLGRKNFLLRGGYKGDILTIWRYGEGLDEVRSFLLSGWFYQFKSSMFCFYRNLQCRSKFDAKAINPPWMARLQWSWVLHVVSYALALSLLSSFRSFAIHDDFSHLSQQVWINVRLSWGNWFVTRFGIDIVRRNKGQIR